MGFGQCRKNTMIATPIHAQLNSNLKTHPEHHLNILFSI